MAALWPATNLAQDLFKMLRRSVLEHNPELAMSVPATRRASDTDELVTVLLSSLSIGSPD